MKIKNYNIIPYKLKFKNEFRTSVKSIKEKAGFKLELISENGNSALGDCCPLFEANRENVNESEILIKNLIEEIKDIEIDSIEQIQNISEKLEDVFSAQHCVSQALLNLYSKEQNKDLIDVLNLNFTDEIEANGIIGLHPVEESLEIFSDQINRGFKTIKLKIGRNRFSDDIDFLEKIRKYFSDDIKIRLDINAAWSFNEACIKLKEIAYFNIEYIEQPLNNLHELLELAANSPVNIAVDESLKNISNAEIIMNNGSIKYFVLKPMRIGRILDSIRLIRLAEEKGISVTISSSFESEIGFKNLLMLASICKNKNAHGLSTYLHLENFSSKDLFNFSEGKISILNKSIFNS